MTTQSVEYRSCVRLYCGVDLPTSVILCVPSELVVQVDPPDVTSTIAAVMETETCTPAAGCTAAYWTYIFTFEGDQLIEGAVLTGEMITGVICENCFTEWVRETANLTQCDLATSDSNTISLAVNTGPCQTIAGSVRISAVLDNAIIAEADGLYVPQADIQAGYANLCIDVTPVIYPGAGEQVLMSCSIPANTLSLDGDRLEVVATGGSENNANDKRIRVRFGGFVTNVDTLAFLGGGFNWKLEIAIVRTGAATQSGIWSFTLADPADITQTPTMIQTRFTGTADLTAIADLEVTAEADAASDLNQFYMSVDKVSV